MRNLKQCNKENYAVLNKILYNITGLEYYFYLTNLYPFNFADYWRNLNELRVLINKGEICKYPIICNKIELPYEVNNCIIF